MKNKIINRLVISIMVLLVYANAWEVNTHRAIDKEASSIATNLNTFMDDAKLDKIESYENKYDDYLQKSYNTIWEEADMP